MKSGPDSLINSTGRLRRTPESSPRLFIPTQTSFSLCLLCCLIIWKAPVSSIRPSDPFCRCDSLSDQIYIGKHRTFPVAFFRPCISIHLLSIWMNRCGWLDSLSMSTLKYLHVSLVFRFLLPMQNCNSFWLFRTALILQLPLNYWDRELISLHMMKLYY